VEAKAGLLSYERKKKLFHPNFPGHVRDWFINSMIKGGQERHFPAMVGASFSDRTLFCSPFGPLNPLARCRRVPRLSKPQEQKDASYLYSQAGSHRGRHHLDTRRGMPHSGRSPCDHLSPCYACPPFPLASCSMLSLAAVHIFSADRIDHVCPS